MGEDTIQTPYGELRATALNELQSSFDTRHLLSVVDALDRFCAQWKGEWRAALLGVHNIAHTVINGAPPSGRRGEETLPEAAFAVSEELREWGEALETAVELLDRIAELKPD